VKSGWRLVYRLLNPDGLYVFSAGHKARRARPEGQGSLAQGLPWVSPNKRWALKGLEMRTRSGAKVRNRFSLYLVAPSGLIPVGK
jgi:hypothetical protein